MLAYKMVSKRERICLKITLLHLLMSLCVALCLISNVLCGENKTCKKAGTFQHFLDVSWKKCSEECIRRKRCQLFMYRQEMKYCTLKDFIEVSILETSAPICGYFKRDEYLSDDIGPCRVQPCDNTERCFSKTKTKYECLKTECLAPKQLENAKLLSNSYSVGTTNRYKCNKGCVAHGSPSIVCTKNGTWSQTDFKCALPSPPMACPELQPIYFNAIRANTEIVVNVGTVVSYTCRTGYTKLTEKFEATCLKSGKWSRQRIVCCPDDTAIIIDDYCRVEVNGGLVSDRQEAIEYCEKINGSLSWVFDESYHVFNKSTTTYVLHSESKLKVNSRLNYTKCAAENGRMADPYHNMTFDEKINEIREKNWRERYCLLDSSLSFEFIRGQPDGGLAEQCLVRDLQQNFEFLDMPCMFEQKNVGFMCYYILPSLP